MRKTIIKLLIAVTLSGVANGQVRTNYNNTDLVNERGRFQRAYSPQQIFQVAAPDLTEALRREQNEVSLGSKEFFIAEPVRVDINVKRLANWVTNGNFQYGKFTLQSSGAKTLSINFRDFHLPNGTEMYIYNKNAEMITGVITEAENNADKIWGSSIYKGEELTVEVKIPVNEKENLSLHINNVAYGYKDIFISKTSGFGLSGGCNVNVLCPAGNAWAAERNSVVYIARSNGSALCSGSMVMNTSSTNIPYVLTADHCYNADNNVAGWRIHFQAWSAACTPSTNSDGLLFNGATHRANWQPGEFALVQLNQTPPLNSGINYAGWTRSTTAATSGVGIHHPSGDVMKISDYSTTLVREDDPERCGINPIGIYHWVVQWNTAITEGGSSGSPLFDQNHRIVGQLSGGPSFCAQPPNCRMDMYGRFDNSWTGGGTNATRLSNWLDPTGTGATTTNTTDICSLTPSPALVISGNSTFCTGTTSVSLNVPAGTPFTWQVLSGGATIPSSGNPVNVTRTFDGLATIKATITCNTNLFATKQIGIGTPYIEFLQFSNGADEGQYFCTSHIGNQFETLIEFPPASGSIQWRLRSWPSLSLVYTDPNQYPVGSPISVGSFYAQGWYVLEVNLTTDCGSTGWVGYEVEFIDCSMLNGLQNFSIQASPNPTTTDLYVGILNEKKEVKALKSSEKLRMVLYDLGGARAVRQWSFNNDQKRFRLNVAGIKKGQYVLVVTKGKFRQTKQITIR